MLLSVFTCSGIGVGIRASYAVYASYHQIRSFSKLTCVLVNIVQGSARSIQFFALLAIAFDRLAAIRCPTRYRSEVSKVRKLGLTLGNGNSGMVEIFSFLKIEKKVKICEKRKQIL